MEVITRDTEEVRAYFEALQDYRTQRLIPYISLPGKTLYRQSDLLRMLEENYVDMRPKRKRGKSPT